MYVHKACKPSEGELDYEKKAGGFCALCGIQGTVYHVKGSPDYYQHILNSILYNVSEGVESTPMEAVWAAERIKTAKVKAARKGENWTAPEILTAPRKKGMSEVPPEAESTEETEAVEEAVDEAIGPILKEAIELEKEPDRVELKAIAEDIEKAAMLVVETATKVAERALEAEPELTREELEARLAQLEAEAKK